MFEFVSESFNRIIDKKITYKCLAYIDDKTRSDKAVDAFEIKEYSLKRAYKVAYDVLKLKYPDMGLDIRVFTK
jgi:hypothetical protein